MTFVNLYFFSKVFHSTNCYNYKHADLNYWVFLVLDLLEEVDHAYAMLIISFDGIDETYLDWNGLFEWLDYFELISEIE